MNKSNADIFRLYQELQRWVDWQDADAQRVAATAELLVPHIDALVDDFYEEISRHPEATKVFTGGQAQIDRLKGTLRQWLRELLAGRYDEAYAGRRWQVGLRHVEIGLDQVYANAALARLRQGLTRYLRAEWKGDRNELEETILAFHKLLDLDLAKISDAYQNEFSDRLQRSERLVTIGQVAGGVAHELRNPLNVVKTSVYYLLNAKNMTPEKRLEHLQRIENHVTLADGVITALSNFTKMSLPTRAPFAVEACLRDVLGVSSLPANIQVAVDCPPTLPPVVADRDQMRIVFSNLVRNAREAMLEGGQLRITGRAVAGGVEVDVADTGAGIASGHLSRIMEPLYTTKARGLGLGLALARAIVEKNGGRLRAVSGPGRGSTFTVFLPTEVLTPA